MVGSCICGSNKTTKKEQDLYEVTPEGDTVLSTTNGASFITCDDCGLVRQKTSFQNERAFKNYYSNYPPTKKSYKTKIYDHDRDVANKRCTGYKINKKEKYKILDVGSGSGAFVDECRDRGQESYGCEIAEYDCSVSDEFIYKKALQDIHFPTDHFDKVFCHDVLEHVLNPKDFIDHLFRITKQEGFCIIEIPRFFDPAGKHHWKREHLWYFKVEELSKLLKQAGFNLHNICFPIESKVTFYLQKPIQKRVKILVPPGIGDSFWSIIKVESFLKKKGLSLPDICIASPRDKEYEGHKRAFPFLEMFPFIKSSWEVYDCQTPERRKIWLEAYRDQGRTIFTDVPGYDYFISYNGWLRIGKQMEELDVELETKWNTPMFESLEQIRYQKYCEEKFGKFIAFYFVFGGTYEHWTREFSVDRVIQSINIITEETGYIPIFIGAKWDKERDDKLKQVKRGVSNAIDMTGKTTIEQAFGLMKASQLVVGYPSGLTILSSVLGAKTLIIWNDFYNKEFAWNCCPPDTKENNYFIITTKNLTPRILTKKVKEIL